MKKQDKDTKEFLEYRIKSKADHDFPHILLFWGCGFGDAIFCLPAIRILRKRYPDAQIIVTVSAKEAGQLFEDAKVGVKILFFKRDVNGGILSILRIFWQVWEERIDIVMSRGLIDSWRVPLGAFISRAGWRIGLKSERLSFLYNLRMDMAEGGHACETLGVLLKGLGIEVANGELLPYLEPPKEAKELAERKWQEAGLDGVPAVALSSGADKTIRGGWKPALKRWKAENYSCLANWLDHEKGVKVVMFGVEGEAFLAEEVRNRARVEVVNLCGKTSLGELQWLLLKCKALVCNDTGSMHMASALGVPVVALFGPTNPEVFGPRGNRHRVVLGKTNCSPCYPNPTCNLPKCQAMDRISPAMVIGQLKDFL